MQIASQTPVVRRGGYLLSHFRSIIRNKASGIVRGPVQEKFAHVASLRFHAAF